MQPTSTYYSEVNPDALIWFVAILITLFGVRYLKNFFAWIFMKLYEFFIEQNAAEL